MSPPAKPDGGMLRRWIGQWLAKAPKPSAPASAAVPALIPEAERLRVQGNQLLDEGKLAQAASTYRRACAVDPQSVPAWVNLGFSLLELGSVDEAATALRKALELDATNFDAHFMLGRLAIAQNNFTIALPHLDVVLRAQPAFALAHCDRGRALYAIGERVRARAAISSGLQIDDQLVDLHHYLGNMLADDGDWEQAVASYERALTIQPKYPELRTRFGQALAALGRHDEARQQYRLALGERPGTAEACQALGLAMHALGMLDEAIAAYRMAITARPDCAPAHQNLGLGLQAQGKAEQAVASFEKAAALLPASAEAVCNVGRAYEDLRREDEALTCYRRAISLQPEHAMAHAHLATLMVSRGDVAAAMPHFERALALDASLAAVRSNQLFAMCFDSPPATYLAAAREYGQLVMALARPFTNWRVDLTDPTPTPLRVGLVSGDLFSHPVGFFIESILQSLGAHGVEIHAYPTSHHSDEVTTRLKARCAGWNSLVGMSDELAAQRIRDDRIHILIDLAGHTANNRLPVFAWRPAPLQASWLGYFASTGLPAIDYVLADERSVPNAALIQFSEAVWRLPETRLCLTAPGDASSFPIGALPALRNGHLTLGCFQSLGKLNAHVLQAWRQILAQLPTARLRLQSRQSGNLEQRQRMLELLTAAGIDTTRVELAPPAPRAAYLASYGEVDMLLDTFPFPGGTTTCEALWMGVPTLTLGGKTMLERQGQALLDCAGLPDWVALSEAEYVQRAVAHGRDVDALAQLRARLRAQVVASPLFDSVRFAEGLAKALTALWQQRADSA